jgi:hypothetical protein
MAEKISPEALGYHTLAMRRVSALEGRRHNEAAGLGRHLTGAALFAGGGIVSRFDCAEMLKKAEALARTNIELEQAIAEADSYAEAAGEKKVRRNPA